MTSNIFYYYLKMGLTFLLTIPAIYLVAYIVDKQRERKSRKYYGKHYSE